MVEFHQMYSGKTDHARVLRGLVFAQAEGCGLPMSQKRLASVSLAILACLGVLLSSQPALACSVCAGDPSSPLNQGLQAGMLVLLGVVYVLLGGLASLFVFWMRRAAHQRAQVDAAERASQAVSRA